MIPPARRLTVGVRPNSPAHNTTVFRSRSRFFRSRIKAAKAGSRMASCSRVDLVVVGMGVPAVEGDLDAAHAHLDQPPRRQAAPAKRRVAVISAQASGSCETSKAFNCSELIMTRARRDGLAVQGGSRASPAAGEGALDDVQIADALPSRPAGTRAATSGSLPRGSPVRKASYSSPRNPPRPGHCPGRIEMCRGMSVLPTGSSWQQIAPIDGCIDRRVGPVAGLHHVGAAPWSPSLLTIERIRATEPICSARCSKPSASCTPLTAVSMASVPAGDPGAGMGVERLELAGPALEPEQDDRLRRPPGPLGLRRPAAARGASASSARPTLEEAAAVDSRSEWREVMRESSMVP